MRRDALEKQTLPRLAGRNDAILTLTAEQPLARIQPQVGLAMFLIWPVTLHAVMGQHRANIDAESHHIRLGRMRLAKRNYSGQGHQKINPFSKKLHGQRNYKNP